MIISTLLCLVFIYYLYRRGIASDPEKMKVFIAGFGIYAPAAFLLIYILSIVFPVIPGGMINLIGVLLFGPFTGFLYNYLGSIAGSYTAFEISRSFGEKFLISLIGREEYDKKMLWLNTRHRFDISFALMIFLPGAPDDLMCYIAGLTDMSRKKFLLLLSSMKIPGTLIYSFGISSFWELFA